MAKIKKKKYKQPKLHALYKQGKLGSRKWQLDFDYIKKLSLKDKIYLNKFIQEHHLADFREDHPLHKTKEARREVYSRNNSSNRCITSLATTKTKKVIANTTEVIDSLLEKRDVTTLRDQTEDAFIDLIDLRLGNTQYPEESED